MRIAMVAAEFTRGRGQQVAPLHGDIQAHGTRSSISEKRFIEGMCERGYPQKFVENCFKQIEGFGEYGFPESHAASFALLVYASAWIKCHYPDVFADGAAQQPADGFLRHRRNSCVTRRSTASRCGRSM